MSIDHRKLPDRELSLYMSLVIGFCADMRHLLADGSLTVEGIDRYETTVVSNLLAEINSRSAAAPERPSAPTPRH